MRKASMRRVHRPESDGVGRPEERKGLHGAGKHPRRTAGRRQHDRRVREHERTSFAAPRRGARRRAGRRRRQTRSAVGGARHREEELRRVAAQRHDPAAAGRRQSRADRRAEARRREVERAEAALRQPGMSPLGADQHVRSRLTPAEAAAASAMSLPAAAIVNAYLVYRSGYMVYYTPGSHLLIALAGAWTRTDGLHALYPVVAFTVALKAGFVFLIALRLLPAGLPRTPIAVGAVLLLLLPRAYFLGSFTEHSFIAQVVAELFAVVMLWALVVWEHDHWFGGLVLFAFAGRAAFLAWPSAI